MQQHHCSGQARDLAVASRVAGRPATGGGNLPGAVAGARPAQRRSEVLGTPEQGHHLRVCRDLREVHHAPGGFDQGDCAKVFGKRTAVGVGVTKNKSTFHLRHHHGPKRRVRDGGEVVGEIGRIDGVNAHDGALRVQVRVDYVLPSLGAVFGAAAVLEVEDDHVGTVSGLGEALGAVGRGEQ